MTADHPLLDDEGPIDLHMDEITFNDAIDSGRYGPDHVCNFDRILFGGGTACTICDAIEQVEP
jgi:hypothetical protein